MRWLLLLAVAGCAEAASGRDTPRGSAAPIDASVGGALDDAAEPLAWTMSTKTVPVTAPVERSLVTSMHGSAITLVAATEDGRAAVTADGRSVRLWPSLDGKHEPVIVAMRTPLMLAVARDPDGIAIAGVDAIGQLEVVRTTTEGKALSRIAVESPRSIRTIHASTLGVFAQRDDGAIALYEWSGTLRGELPAAAGQHATALAVRHDRALAIVNIDGTVRGQWIEVEAQGLRWGATTPALPIVADRVALSPDQSRIAGVDKRGNLLIVNAKTGHVTRKRSMNEEDAPYRVVGFLDRSSLAFERVGTFIDTEGGMYSDEDDEVVGEGFVAGDRVVVGADGPTLVIRRTDEATQFLGYQMAGPISLVPRGTGFLMTEGRSLVQLGRDLRVTKLFDLAPHDDDLYNPTIADEDHVITAFIGGEPRTEGTYLVDVKTKQVTSLGENYSRFDRGSGLFVMRNDNALMMRRYDRKKHAFGEPLDVELLNGETYTWVDSTRGDLALVGPVREPDVTIRVVRVGKKLKVLKTWTMRPPAEWWRNEDPDTLLDESWRPTNRRPNPDRTLFAEVRSDGRMTLHEADGTERWMVPSAGARDVVWTPRGELVAFGSGIARVDVATGALLERQCGWRFGLWDTRPEVTNPTTLCEAP